MTQARESRTPIGESASNSALVRESARREFDKWARSYDRSLLNEIVFYPSIRTCQEEILRWQMRRGARPYAMLDVGCGTGTLLTVMSRDPLAETLVGLDYSPVMVRNLRAKIDRSGTDGRMHAVVGDSERLPFAEARFDVVTCCNSFHHYPHQEQVIRGFRRALRPGGLLVLIDGFRDNVIGWVIFDVGVASVERHVHHASWSEVRSMMASAGFGEMRQRKMNVLAPLLVNVAVA